MSTEKKSSSPGKARLDIYKHSQNDLEVQKRLTGRSLKPEKVSQNILVDERAGEPFQSVSKLIGWIPWVYGVQGCACGSQEQWQALGALTS